MDEVLQNYDCTINELKNKIKDDIEVLTEDEKYHHDDPNWDDNWEIWEADWIIFSKLD